MNRLETVEEKVRFLVTIIKQGPQADDIAEFSNIHSAPMTTHRVLACVYELFHEPKKGKEVYWEYIKMDISDTVEFQHRLANLDVQSIQ